MQLNKLLSPVEISEIIGCGDKEITGVTADSRQVRDGYMFVAVPGVSVDGHAYIHKAQESGASVVVCERLPEQISSSVTYVVVPSSAIALGYIASEWWGCLLYTSPSPRDP